MIDPVDDLARNGFNSPLGRVLSQLLLSCHPRTIGYGGGRLTIVCNDREITLSCADLERATTPEEAAALLRRKAPP